MAETESVAEMIEGAKQAGDEMRLQFARYVEGLKADNAALRSRLELAERERDEAREQLRIVVDVKWQLTRARTALENWGNHFSYCAKMARPSMACNCGFESAIDDASISDLAAPRPNEAPDEKAKVES